MSCWLPAHSPLCRRRPSCTGRQIDACCGGKHRCKPRLERVWRKGARALLGGLEIGAATLEDSGQRLRKGEGLDGQWTPSFPLLRRAAFENS